MHCCLFAAGHYRTELLESGQAQCGRERRSDSCRDVLRRQMDGYRGNPRRQTVLPRDFAQVLAVQVQR